MKPLSIPRRAFLASGLAGLAGLAALVALPLAPRRLLGRCAHGGARLGPHPTPRPGIDASRIPASSALGDDAGARTAFDQVRQIPGVADGIRCHCGCADRLYSLLACYEGEHPMAMHCQVCQGEGRLAYRLHRAGKTLDEIRAAIDDRYG